MSIDAIAGVILQKRKVLLWIGAGSSVSAGIRTDADTEEGLAFQLALIHYNDDRDRIATNLGQRFRLADLARIVGKPRIRQLILQQAWNELPPSEVHNAIAALAAEGFRLEIVTVNFDPLLEKALLAEALDLDVIHCAANVRNLAEDHVFVVKLHGCPFRDHDSNNLLILHEDLENPPQWVITFLSDRLAERVAIYVGFSGNAAYVWDCVRSTSATLRGNVNETFGIDTLPAEEVFDGGSRLGEFYTLSGITQAHYSSTPADDVFRQVADRVFRTLVLRELELAAADAGRHGAGDFEWLTRIVETMSYRNIRSFARKLNALAHDPKTVVRNINVRSTLKWILILTSKGLIETSSLKPALACPYYPGQQGRCSAPIVLFDGQKKEAQLCSEEINELRKDAAFAMSVPVAAEPRWYAIIVNCTGNIGGKRLGVIPRDEQSIVAEYDPVIFRDENTMLSNVDTLQELFT